MKFLPLSHQLIRIYFLFLKEKEGNHATSALASSIHLMVQSFQFYGQHFGSKNLKAELWEGEYIGGKILWVKFSEGSKERENHASASGELVSILHPLPWKCAQCSAGGFQWWIGFCVEHTSHLNETFSDIVPWCKILMDDMMAGLWKNIWVR